jgi:hypothetical protein
MYHSEDNHPGAEKNSAHVHLESTMYYSVKERMGR